MWSRAALAAFVFFADDLVLLTLNELWDENALETFDHSPDFWWQHRLLPLDVRQCSR
jgi:hypothetical protein